MKICTLILLLVAITCSAFSQQSPFSSCWLFTDTTVDQGSVSSIRLDTAGRAFMNLYDNTALESIVLDENGNKISGSPYYINAVAKSGNYYRSYSIPDPDMITTNLVIEKVMAFGDLIWRDTLGYANNADDYAFELTAVDEDLIITGWNWLSLDSSTHFIYKLNQTGDVEWTNEMDDFPGPLIVLSNGNYLVGGITDSSDISVTNITNTGQILWHTTLNSIYDPRPLGFVEGNNGGCYVFTTTTDLDDPYANQILVVDYLDENGNSVPNTQYFEDENLSTPIKDSQGNLLMSSYLDYYGDAEYIFLRKIDTQLNILWVQGNEEYYPSNVDLVIDSNDNSYWLTASEGYNSACLAILYKNDSDGTLAWQLLKEGSNSDTYIPGGLDLRNNEDILLLGVDGPPFQNSSLLSLESLDLNGDSLWESVFDTVMSPVYASLTKLNDDEYYLAGKYYASSIQQGRFCLKLCPSDVFNSNSVTGLIADEMTFSIYPNPVSESATVSFALNTTSPAVIELMDVNGELLKVISREQFSAGNHDVNFDRESLPAGIYFLQLKTNAGVVMKKMVFE